MARGADGQRVERGFGHRIDDRRRDPALEVTQLAIQPAQHFRRIVMLERVRAKALRKRPMMTAERSP